VPIRIYALAKELKVDSKELVELCARAGVSGKGSALASLTDDELIKVKAYLSGDRSKPASATVSTATMPGPSSAPIPFTRDDYIGPTGGLVKTRTIVTKPPKPVVEPPPEPEPEKIVEPEPVERPAKSPQRKEPVIRLATIPHGPEPAPPPQPQEPAPQKPIMTLPADAIRSAKTGRTAPLEQFTKHTEKKREAERTEKRAPTMSPLADASSGSTTRDRRKPKPTMPGDEVDEERDKLANLANSRAARQQKRRRSQVQTVEGEEETEQRRQQRKRLVRKGTNTAAPRKGKVTVSLPCTVRSFSEATGTPTAAIQRALLSLGSLTTINTELNLEMAELLAAELELDVEFKLPETLEDKMLAQMDAAEDDTSLLQTRPPIVTFLGHVDHGKTSLLDRIIGIDVVSGEAGGITQHIRAYKIAKDDREIAFVDTPGHEAFTEMRARGANVTDIAVLVVAADDGVMPQTEEAISHAKAAEVPIVVALNKIDLPGANINYVYQGLAQHGLLPVEWGGDVEVVKTSAITGAGIDDLLETVLLTADLHEYKANPDRSATGTCLEAEQEGNRGVVSKVIVKNGTLRVGDIVVCGSAHGRVKAMYDTLNPRKKVLEAGPSTPVNLTGLDVAPEAGDPFHVLADIAVARQIAQDREMHRRSRSLGGRTVRVSFEEFQRRLEEGRLGNTEDVAVLNLILRADVRGSIEAILKELAKLEHPEVKVKVLQASVGGITSADVTLADASTAVIVGFNVIPDEAARNLADERGVEIRRYDIIYKLTDDIRAMLEGKLKPAERVSELGRALVQRTFTISRLGTVAGCRVLAGTIERGCRIRVNRDGRGIGDYPLDSLKREKDDTREVREGFECGMKLSGFNDLKEGDILEAYKIEEVARTL
jgi:translation initiation factor IF-2